MDAGCRLWVENLQGAAHCLSSSLQAMTRNEIIQQLFSRTALAVIVWKYCRAVGCGGTLSIHQFGQVRDPGGSVNRSCDLSPTRGID
jgi:hypothetical protein